MYIAFKWLVALALIMWVSMCLVDCFIKGSFNFKNTGSFTRQIESMFKNITAKTEFKTDTPRKVQSYEKDLRVPYLYITMFVAGALTVSIFHKKEDIIIFAQKKISLIYISAYIKTTLWQFKKTALTLGVTIFKYLQYFGGKIETVLLRIIENLKVTNPAKQNRIHAILLNKLKEVGEERKDLGQLLIAAIHENKNIRMRYQLETMSKNRLVKHIENTQKQIKENRSRYVSFQQLYLVTHQENKFLKTRIRKLMKDKDDAEKNLIGLINEVYRSKNKELKAYCSRFIVKTKENLLNSDVNEEISEFLEKTRTPSRISSNNNITSAHSWPSSTRVTEILNEDDSLVPLVSDAPKLRGLPGEYVWTVKDKNGIIEKLYEYDYESYIDSGDTIKRIRQYSVYYDKDCLLDFSRMEPEAELTTCRSRTNKLDCPLANQKIVTGSEAFQKFLQNNNSIVPTKSSTSSMFYNT